ncbi:MAG: ABC transporter ATP-binding protein [Spirochaetes bacterium]|nr:ABC transporter ATP-binding protein [Spirochaetota bacterium]MBN2770460.1 ABC transporter ATP-binding protein [Spirochaetota bacterium]
MKIESLCYKIKKKPILDDISFNFKEGMITGLIGRSGSGKTALLNVLAGAVEHTDGRILQNNEILPASKRKKKSMLFPGKTDYSPYMTIKELILSGTPRHFYKQREAYSQIEDFIHAVCLYFHLTPYLQFHCGEVPDAILKKSYLAASFITLKPLMFLDNPDTHLDPLSLIQLINLIHHISIEKRVRFVIASHNINFIFSCCTHYIALGKGQVLFSDKKEKITDQIMGEIFGMDIVCNHNIANGSPEFHFYHQV